MLYKPIDFEPPISTAPLGLEPAFAFGYEDDFWVNTVFVPFEFGPKRSLIELI